MFQHFLNGRLPAVLVVALLAGLTLAACGGASEPAGEAPATVEEAAVPAEEKPAEPEAEVEVAGEAEDTAATVEPVAEVTEEVANEDLSAEPAPASCQAVDIPDNLLIAEVSDSDWAKGPADAPVTLIEYGDFQ